MNLKGLISEDVWITIEKSYESGDYRNAILDAMRHVTAVLREKTGSQEDGVKLVGDAFKKNKPLLQINRLSTSSEKSAQEGMSLLLMGIYRNIRNPRTHEKAWKDSKEDADAIILFLDHLMGIIDEAKTPYSINEFIDSVMDPMFVEKDQYASLLVSEIPDNKLEDTFMSLYHQRIKVPKGALGRISKFIMNRLSPDQIEAFVNQISIDLTNSKDENEIHSILIMIRPDIWPKVEEKARIRIEDAVLKSIKKGRSENGRLEGIDANSNGYGYFAIPFREFLDYFSEDVRVEIVESVVTKVSGHDQNAQNYVYSFFGDILISRPNLIGGWDIIYEHIAGDIALSYRFEGTDIENRSGALKWLRNNHEDLPHEDLPQNWLSSLMDGRPNLLRKRAGDYDDIPF